MIEFDFETIPSLICSTGISARLGPLLQSRFDIEAVSIVTDRGVRDSGLLEPVIGSLQNAGYRIDIDDNVVADPPDHLVEASLVRARAFDTDLVIGIGGGSSLDTAKLVALMARSEQSLQEVYGVEQVRGSRATQLVLMPTTAGTGSEVTPIAIVTTGSTTKSGIVARQLYPDLAVLDAKLTLGLPPAITAATGVDAMVHAIEAYTSKLRMNPLSDMLSREALSLLSSHLVEAVKNGQNLEAREAMLLGSTLAGQAFANAPVAGVHALAYPLGGLFHVPHGLSNALVLPHVLRFNLSAASARYAELASITAPHSQGSVADKALAFIESISDLVRQTSLPSGLSSVGVGREDLETLADEAMKQERLLVNNPVPISRTDAVKIYEAAL